LSESVFRAGDRAGERDGESIGNATSVGLATSVGFARAAGTMSTTTGRGGALAGMVDRRVHVITNDGRHVVGTLRGFDQVVNVILEDCRERVYSSESGVEEAPLGLYVIRGDNVCVR